MTATDPIVLTGTGLATGLGVTKEQTWAALRQRRSAMKPLTALESPLPPGRDGGQADELPADFAPTEPREVRYLRWTLAAALRDAGITPGGALPYPADRCAILLGTTLHGMRAAGRFLRSGNHADLTRFLAGSTLAAAAADLGFTGMAATTCSACSSSLGSVALAVTLLQSGAADLVVAGGYDTISEYVYGGFNSLRLIADGPLRPFARDRQGMKIAEGYGLIVLERAEPARARGARALATVLGWGESADAHHLTQPHPHGDGAARAIDAALARADRSPQQIDLIAAHATGTPDNDAGEYAALARVFGPHLAATPVVAFKSQLGHTLGAAGAVELILSALSLQHGILPPTANTTTAEIEFPDLRLTVDGPRPAALRTTLNTSLGFGGANTAVVLGPPATGSHRSTPPRAEPVFITGVGVVLPGIVGNEALASTDRETSAGGTVDEASLEGLLNARRVRRMSEYVKLTLAATTLALRDAGIDDVPGFAATCAAVLGTTHGCSNYSETYYRMIVNEGIAAANPALFAEAVPNAAAAQLSLMLSLKGACQTVIGTRTAGLDALTLAAARLGSGAWDRAIIGAGEEFCAMIQQAYRSCDDPAAAPTPPLTAGSVMFILETRRSLESRPGGRPRAQLLETSSLSGGHLLDALARTLQQLKDPTVVVPAAPAGTLAGRAERAALRRANLAGPAESPAIAVTSADAFSIAPLLALAEALVRPASPDFAVVAADPVGLAAGARIKRL